MCGQVPLIPGRSGRGRSKPSRCSSPERRPRGSPTLRGPLSLPAGPPQARRSRPRPPRGALAQLPYLRAAPAALDTDPPQQACGTPHYPRLPLGGALARDSQSEPAAPRTRPRACALGLRRGFREFLHARSGALWAVSGSGEAPAQFCLADPSYPAEFESSADRGVCLLVGRGRRKCTGRHETCQASSQFGRTPSVPDRHAGGTSPRPQLCSYVKWACYHMVKNRPPPGLIEPPATTKSSLPLLGRIPH